MKNQYRWISALLYTLAAIAFSSCNDNYLERLPKTNPTRKTAFKTYENFKAYVYPFYGMFTDNRIATNFNHRYYPMGQFYSDFYAGVMTTRDNFRNPYAYQTFQPVTKSTNWDFTYIRDINIMLSELENSDLTPSEQEHWRSVGYFFHSFWYAELVAKYGDVPYYDIEMTDQSEEAYKPRTPRAEVVSSIIQKLEYAIANIGSSKKDGDHPLTVDAIRAFLSRFLLREATWAKYHNLDEPWKEYLEKCLKVSDELMKKYPTLYTGSRYNTYPGAGYDELFTKEDLTNVPGVIMFKQYIEAIAMHRFSDYVHVEAHRADAPQHTVDLFLMKNGKPIESPGSGFKGGEGKDLWDYYEDRDPRLHINFQPPYQAKVTSVNSNPDNVTTFKKWTFWKAGEKLNGGPFTITEEYARKFRTYIDYFGPNIVCEDGGGVESIGVKRVPGHNWGGAMVHSSPNITKYAQTDNYMRCWTGYYFWKHYTSWEKGANNTLQTSDKPIFTIEEVLLNYAEAASELGRFDQTVADRTINKLRQRVGVSDLIVSEVTEDFDPARDRGQAPWTKSYGPETNYEVPPVLWEIRRERMVELMGQGFSFYDVKRWHKAPYYVNRQPSGAWVTAKDLPYGKGTYRGQFVDYNEIKTKGYALPQNNDAGQGWIYTIPGPLAEGKGWKDTYYLEMIPTYEINMSNGNLKQNPGWDSEF